MIQPGASSIGAREIADARAVAAGAGATAGPAGAGVDGAGLAGADAGVAFDATSVEAPGRPITERARTTAPNPATARTGTLCRFQSGTRSFGAGGATWADDGVATGITTGITGGGAIVGVTTSGSSSMSPAN